MEKTTFSEICRMMKDGRKSDRELIGSILDIGVLFLPALINPSAGLTAHIATGADLLAVKGAIGNLCGNIKEFLTQGNDADFTSKYERAQAAQVLLVFSAYFDTLKMYLPDESRKIQISENEKATITEQSIKEYGEWMIKQSSAHSSAKERKEILDYPLDFQAPLESKDIFKKRLKKFYEILNEQFIRFINKLSFVEQLSGSEWDQFMAWIRKLPEKSVENYDKQYYELKLEARDYRIWASIQEHNELKEKIDVGFALLSEKIDDYIAVPKRKGTQTIEYYERLYEGYIDEPLIKTTEIDTTHSSDVVFPTKKNIFVPQKFKALPYVRGISIENENTWNDIGERDNIGAFISDTLRHSVTGKLPLLVLGVPGAGKTLLCHILAAQILSHEYHVVIIRLRDIRAENTIEKQINEQIENDFANQCNWDDIVEGSAHTPILLIFDGYDELLQASGKTCADYITKITEFQKMQDIVRGIQVKCILTSRTTLIDKVTIPIGTTIIKLSEFDQERIDKWSAIWNETNESYFEELKLKPFGIDPTSKLYDLAKQPLLLLLLALYDSNGNALMQNSELTSAQLYDRLIRDFIEREQKKAPDFCKCTDYEQKKRIECELERVSIAAIGMYNRNILDIQSDVLEKDLKYLLSDSSKGNINSNAYGRINESDKVLGSFFFIYRADLKEENHQVEVKDSVYAFMHNTFGEFLTANYIVGELCKLVKYTDMLMSSQLISNWSLEKMNRWFVCLSYEPLSSRPNVVKMIREWAYDYFNSNGVSKEQVLSAMRFILDTEIKHVISGEDIETIDKVITENGNPFKKKESLIHLACYSLNLIILGALVSERDKDTFTYRSEKWDKLIHLWKYAFQKGELLNFSKLFNTKKTETVEKIESAEKEIVNCQLQYCPNEKENNSGISRLECIAQAIGDSQSKVLISTIMGAGDLDEVRRMLNKYDLIDIYGEYLWNRTLRLWENEDFQDKKKLGKTVIDYCIECMREKDIQKIFDSMLLIDLLLRFRINIINNRGIEYILRLGVNIFHMDNSLPGFDNININEAFWLLTMRVYLSILEQSHCSENCLKFLLREIYSNPEPSWFSWKALSIITEKTSYEVFLESTLFVSYVRRVQHALIRMLRYSIVFKWTHGMNYTIEIMEAVNNVVRLCVSCVYELREDFVKEHEFKEELKYLLKEYVQKVFNFHYPSSSEDDITIIQFLKITKDFNFDSYKEPKTLQFLTSRSPEKVYQRSPEAAYDLCCLIEDHLNDYPNTRKGLERIFNTYKTDLSVKFYRKLQGLLVDK